MIRAVPLSLKEAQAFINRLHRHHVASAGDKFRVGCEVDGVLVGVAQCGRPVSRYLDDGQTLEVLRLCTDGTKNVCSFLYSRCARVAQELGYKKIITYILESEMGASLRASGWYCDEKNDGGGHGLASQDRENLNRFKWIYSELNQNTRQKGNKDGRKI